MTRLLKAVLPAPVARALGTARFRVLLAARRLPRWWEILRGQAGRDGVRVYYGRDRLPGPDETAYGGMVKFQLLERELHNDPRRFNVLYLGSSSLPPDTSVLALLARRRGAKLVWNQNGVAYPGWHGPGWERANRVPARLLRVADHVFFQSAFCKLSADRFLGEPKASWEILHNPVDVEAFAPAPQRPPRPLTLLLGGNQYQRYRFEAALRTLAELPDARLVVTGALSWAPGAETEGRQLVSSLALGDRVELVGPYAQRDAPELLRRGDVLLHTKYNDPCPTIVLEAMACGLPVVYSSSGGTPELVGPDAGVGIPAPLDWDDDHPPAPHELARAVERVAARLEEYALAARQRALRFDARAWVARHREVFEELTA